MAICGSCGQANPAGFKFCPACGSPVGALAPVREEERKVVTVLFCDLAGFTARSDQADPEDVRARLRPYHVRLRTEIERFGGTLDKFIGDGVMAVFGAPVAHEDDPERAVRAALRMLDAIAQLNEANPALELSVRIGITTGEAVVSLTKGNESEGVVGDVVNTASRLEGVAPIGGVVVGEPTWRATRELFDFNALEPVRVKGKAEPLAVWQALAPRSRQGSEVGGAQRTPYIGREAEQQLLRHVFERSVREQSVQLVTMTGEPGVGKSRLVSEFFAFIDNEATELVAWRQGRCLPYGEGITFWALGEIVKAQAGILESDGAAEAGARLDAAVARVTVEEADRNWLRARLAPLVGLTAATEQVVERTESFTAWRRFLEGVAATGPLVLVVEDLHWGDPALLEFLEHLVDWATGVPLLVLCTARPELYERHPAWSGGKRNSTTIALSALSDQETARLLAALLERAVLPAEVQALLLERAGGNPLYAEEFVRMLADRGLLAQRGRSRHVVLDSNIEFPDSLQALIAARLDTLTPERKALLQHAAVFGKVFWAGAVAAMGKLDPAVVRAGLHELGRKELLRPARISEAARGPRPDVPRNGRRPLDVTRRPQSRGLLPPGARTAPDESSGSGAGARPDGGDIDPARSVRRGRSGAGRGGRGLPAGRTDARGRRCHGSPRMGGVVSRRDGTLERAADPGNRAAGARATRSEALDRVRRPCDEPVARWSAPERALAWSDKVLLSSDAPGEAAMLARAARGGARIDSGDLDGLDDLRLALEIALECGLVGLATLSYYNLADAQWAIEGPAASLRSCDAARALADKRGVASRAIGTEILNPLFDTGDWPRLRRLADDFIGREDEGGNGYLGVLADLHRVRVGLFEDGSAPPDDRVASLVATARRIGDPQVLVPALVIGAMVDAWRGRGGAALELLRELDQTTDPRDQYRLSMLPDVARICVAANAVAFGHELLARTPAIAARHLHGVMTGRALLAEAQGDAQQAAALYADAEQRWATYGSVPERGLALLGLGRCLIRLGHPEAGDKLAKAREVFARLGARPLLQETEAWLQRATDPRIDSSELIADG